MKQCAAMLAGLAMAGALCGCTHTTEPAPFAPEGHPHLTQGRIQFESSTTKHLLHVVGIDTSRIGGGLLKVILTLRNTTKDNLWAEVRTTFLDQDRHVLEQTNWEPVLIEARTVNEYTCTSLSSRAADYQIIIRKPKKSSLDLP